MPTFGIDTHNLASIIVLASLFNQYMSVLVTLLDGELREGRDHILLIFII